MSYVFEFGKYAKLLDLANLRLNKFQTYTLSTLLCYRVQIVLL